MLLDIKWQQITLTLSAGFSQSSSSRMLFVHMTLHMYVCNCKGIILRGEIVIERENDAPTIGLSMNNPTRDYSV